MLFGALQGLFGLKNWDWRDWARISGIRKIKRTRRIDSVVDENYEGTGLMR